MASERDMTAPTLNVRPEVSQLQIRQTPPLSQVASLALKTGRMPPP